LDPEKLHYHSINKPRNSFKIYDYYSLLSGKMVAAKRVAIIGAGPAGAITIDALAKEKAFDLIRVFERREAPGGCW
jgi:NADPH-dependent glutamate synthase beta subunit-like oxidoreductase